MCHEPTLAIFCDVKRQRDCSGKTSIQISLWCIKARIGLKNLAYNMRRLVQLERLAAAET